MALTANALAARLSTESRPMSAKTVRGIARTALAQYSKVTHPARQSHDYSEDDAAIIGAIWSARGPAAPVAPVVQDAPEAIEASA